MRGDLAGGDPTCFRFTAKGDCSIVFAYISLIELSSGVYFSLFLILA